MFSLPILAGERNTNKGPKMVRYISIFYKPIVIYFDSGNIKVGKRITIVLLLLSIYFNSKSQDHFDKSFCDSLNSGFKRDQEVSIASYYLYQHPDSTKKDSMKRLTNLIMDKNTDLIKDFFYLHGIPRTPEYNKECIDHFWIVAIHSTQDRQFQPDLITYVRNQGIELCECKEKYALMVDKRRTSDGLPQIYGI